MPSRFQYLVLLNLLVALSASAWSAQSKITGKGSIKNFQTQSEEQQRKTVIRGTNAVEVQRDIYEITQLRVETFRSGNVPELFLESPLCFLNNVTKEAYSSRELRARTPDGKFSIRGTGFTWQSKSTHLVLSNDVEAIIQRAALKIDSTNQPAARAATNSTITINASFFDYIPSAARFEKFVTVKDAVGTMKSESLFIDLTSSGQVTSIDADGGVQIDYGTTRASGSHATFDVESDLFTLTNQTQWASGDRSGSSEWLALNRRKNELHARDQVRLRLPYKSASSTNVPSTNQPLYLNISAGQLDYSTNMAFLDGGVIVDGPQGKLSSAMLKVEFTTNQNQIARAWATGSVSFARADRSASGDIADYDMLGDRVRIISTDLARPTRWSMGERQGTSDTLDLSPNAQEFAAQGHVQIRLPLSARMMPSNLLTNQPATAARSERPQNLSITAGSFAQKGKESIFREQVVATTDQGRVDAETITVTTGTTNQVTKLLAEQNVSIYQKDRVASGQKASYDAASGLMELSGEPRIIDSQATVEAEAFVLDLNNGTFRTRGKYQIHIHTTQKTANVDAAKP